MFLESLKPHKLFKAVPALWHAVDCMLHVPLWCALPVALVLLILSLMPSGEV